MSSPDKGRGDPPGVRNEPVPTTAKATVTVPAVADPTDPYSSWLDRMQRARVRHAAITKNLYTWSNYKSWADKMRDNWDGDAPAPVAPAAHPSGPKPPIKK